MLMRSSIRMGALIDIDVHLNAESETERSRHLLDGHLVIGCKFLHLLPLMTNKARH